MVGQAKFRCGAARQARAGPDERIASASPLLSRNSGGLCFILGGPVDRVKDLHAVRSLQLSVRKVLPVP